MIITFFKVVISINITIEDMWKGIVCRLIFSINVRLVIKNLSFPTVYQSISDLLLQVVTSYEVMKDIFNTRKEKKYFISQIHFNWIFSNKYFFNENVAYKRNILKIQSLENRIIRNKCFRQFVDGTCPTADNATERCWCTRKPLQRTHNRRNFTA